MSIIKERIKSTNQDINLKITLDRNTNHIGYQQEIDKLTEQVKVDLTNPIIDNEVRRFKYKTSTIFTSNIIFYFITNGNSYDNSFLSGAANFTSKEISDKSINLRKSFFIMDFYDNFNYYDQNKFFTIYNTQILNSEVSNYIPIPKYRLSDNKINQFNYWYVPKRFIDNNLLSGNIIAEGYIKFSFYNAKTGQISLFYNKYNESLSTAEKLYFKVKLDLLNMTWYFDEGSFQKAYQIPLNNLYSNKINDSVEKFDNKQQEYPDGNIFNPENGDYETL
jgi:hypothetical protein